MGQAVLALAHRRILTLHAMIRNHTLYNPQPATKPPTAARHTTQRHPRLVTWMYTRTGTIEGRTAIAVDIAR